MNRYMVGLFILIIQALPAPAWCGLLYDDGYDNSRFKNDFSCSDDLLAHASGVACVRFPGNPDPGIGHKFEATLLLVDPGYQRTFWNYYNPSDQSIGFRDFTSNLSYPRSIAASSNGDVFITDVGHQRIVKLRPDYSSGGLKLKWVKEFGRIGKNEGQFINPFKVAVRDFPGCVYVSDWTNHNVQEFDFEGNYIRTIGGSGNEPGKFVNPRGVAINGNYLYIVDSGNGRVQRFLTNTADYHVDKILTRGGELPDDAFFTDIAVSNSGAVYLVDEKHSQIYLFDENLKYISTYRGNPASPFKNLYGISILSPGDTQLFSSQAVTVEKERIQMFLLGMEVLNLTSEPSIFYPLEPAKAKSLLKFTLTESGKIRVYVHDSNNQIVRNLIFNETLYGLGSHSVEWDGKDDLGNILPGGQYYFELVARDMNGYEGFSVKWVYKYCPVRIHEAPVVQVKSVAPVAIRSGVSAKVVCALSKPGLVNAEVLDSGNQVIRTLLTNVEQGTVDYEVAWDGMAAGGNPAADGYYSIRIQAKDSEGYWGEAKSARVAVANAPPAVSLTMPEHGTFGLQAKINGSLGGFLLSTYRIEYSLDKNEWFPILEKTVASGSNSQVGVSGELAGWQTSLLPAGEDTRYWVRLKAQNQAGAEGLSEIRVLVDNIPPRIQAFSVFPDYLSPAIAAAGSTQNAGSLSFQILEGNTLSARLEFFDKYAVQKNELNIAAWSGALSWNGLDRLGKALDDGAVTCRLTARDLGGNESLRTCGLVIDTNRYPETVAVASTKKITGQKEDNFRVCWMPDGRKLAFTEGHGDYANIYLINADGSGTPEAMTFFNSSSTPPHAVYPDIEPDSRRLIFESLTPKAIYREDLSSRAVSLFKDKTMHARWSPDGNKIACTLENGYLKVFYADGSDSWVFNPGWFLNWTPDSRGLLYSSVGSDTPGEVKVMTILGSGFNGMVLQNARYPEYSPDGNLLLFNRDFRFYVRLPGGQERILVDGSNWRQASWAPDGGRLALTNAYGETFVSQLSRPNPYANLTAMLSMPQSGSVDIKGTAADLNFAAYELSYGRAADAYNPPGTWTLLKHSGIEIKNNTLGDWNTAGLSGDYWLKLCVWDKAMNRKEVYKKITLGILGPNLMTHVQAVPETIFPGIPGKNELKIYYTLQAPLSSGLSLKILNDTGAVARSWTNLPAGGPFPKTYFCTWDGQDTNGNPVPSGRYIFRLEAVGGGATLVKEGSILAAGGMPRAVLTAPEQHAYVNREVIFQGTAQGPDFAHYWLEAGAGDSPTAWSLVGESTVPVENRELGRWQAPTEGIYTARLTAHSRLGLQEETRIQFMVDTTGPESLAEFLNSEQKSGGQARSYPSGDTVYIGPNKYLAIAGQDAASGVKTIKVKQDGIESVYASPISLGVSGSRVIEYYGLDQAGNQEPAKRLRIQVDDSLPVTSLAIGQPHYQVADRCYISGKSTLGFTASKSGSPVPVVETQWFIKDAGELPRRYEGPFTLAEYGQGSMTLGYYSVDALGNSGATCWSGLLYCDAEAPQTDLQPQGPAVYADGTGRMFATSATTYSLNAGDQGAGVGHVEYSLRSQQGDSGSNGYTPGDKIFLTSEGENELSYFAVDWLGNAEGSKLFKVIVDNTAPRIDLGGLKDGQTYHLPYALQISIDDIYLKEQAIVLDGQPCTGSPVMAPGVHQLSVWAQDWAGNSRSSQVSFYLTESTATPTITTTLTPSPTATLTPTPSFTVTAMATFTPTLTVTATVTPTSVHYQVKADEVLAYPNPGRGSMNFAFCLEEDSLVKVAVFNLAGEKIAELRENKAACPQGTTLRWNCGKAAPGIYICQATAKLRSGKLKIFKRVKVAVIR